MKRGDASILKVYRFPMKFRRLSGAKGPGEAVGSAADVEMGDHLERFEIDDNNVVVGRAGDEGAMAGGVHEDAGGAVANGDTAHFPS